MYQMYVKTDNNNIIILNGDRNSFRCRQRNKDKKDILKFVSYKSMLKEKKKKKKRVYGPLSFNTISKL